MSDNIRVAIRMRPLITREIEAQEKVHWNVNDSRCISEEPPGTKKCYFDRVFESVDDNWNVYSDLCLPIVQSVMQGFNGTVFAYGQTSSGKTFTMMGEHNGIYKGVMQYAVEDVFNIIETMPDREFLLRVSFIEIYNEKVYDLLSDKKSEDLKLLEDSYGVVNVSGLQEKIVQTSDQIWEWLRKCQKKRRTGETTMNRVSSRSHFIFRMIVESRIKDEVVNDVVNVSQFNLVDLAGSESLKQAKAKDGRFKEGVYINKSLSTLTKVIQKLSDNEYQHITYRESKLTRLLQNSLGGNALTAIICTVTPVSKDETHSTLQFALNAKEIKNKPQKNEILNDQALLKQYANRIKELSQQLEVSKEQGKELEEKRKQNDDLKKQIESLKANFVSQTVINKTKAIRRETWGGCLDARNYPAAFLPPKSSFSSKLAILEEEAEDEVTDGLPDLRKRSRTRGSSVASCISICKDVYNAESQTDIENPEIEEAMMLVSELKSQLTTLQNEFAELHEYTTLEKQLLKADNELQLELETLRKENCTLREEVEVFRKSNLIVSSESELKVNDEVITKNEVSLPSGKSIDEAQNHTCLSSQLNDHSFSSQKYSDHKMKEISKMDVTDSSLLDESLKSNFLAFYDECVESEAVSKLKSVIESLKYDIELKDKQMSLFNDKLQIKEQMIMSLKEEIALGQNIDSLNVNDKVTSHVTCQTDILRSPRKNVFPKECQTTPLKPVNINCITCHKLNTFEFLNGPFVETESSSNFALMPEEILNSSQSEVVLSQTESLDDKENIKRSPENISGVGESFYHLSKDKGMVSVYTEMSPLKSAIDEKCIKREMKHLSSQVTPVKLEDVSIQCYRNQTNEHYVQTVPIKGVELFAEKCKVDGSTEMTSSFIGEDFEKVANLSLFVDQSTQTLCDDIEEKYVVKSNIVSCDNKNLITVTDISVNKTDIKNLCENENTQETKKTLQNHSSVLEKVENSLFQNYSELNVFINKINELKIYTIELMKNYLKTEYLEDTAIFQSQQVEENSLKAADREIGALKNIIMRLEFYIKNREEICEIHNSELDSKYEEVIALKSRLSEAEQVLTEKQLEISALSERISNLYKRISGLALPNGKLNDIESEEGLNSLKNSTDLTISSEFPSKLEHDLALIENLLVKLNSYMEENDLKVFNLTGSLKKAENELLVLKKENIKMCENNLTPQNSTVSKYVQTNDVINTINTIELKKEIMQIKNQLKDQQETNCELENTIKVLKQENADLKQGNANLKASHSEEIDSLEMEFETANSNWNKKTKQLIDDLEAKYDQELIDQQNKWTEELQEKLIEQKQEHLKQVYDLKEEISDIKALHVKELSDVKKHLEDQIKDLEEQLFSENSEKEDLKKEFEKEKKQLMQACQTNCENIRNKYANKIRQCREVNSELKVNVQCYLDEIDKIKKENKSEVFQLMEEKINDLSNERDLLKKRYTDQIKEFQKQINHLKIELKKVNNQKQLKQNLGSGDCKVSAEMNKKLLYDLDQKKAKIMSLEANNTSMVHEIKKLKEMLSSKSVVPCKCKTNSRDSKTDQEKLEEHKEKKKSNVDHRNAFETMPETYVKKLESIHDNEYPKENDDPNLQTISQDDMLCVGGGSGPANMVKCYWLENANHKKDKEIFKLKKQMAALSSELKRLTGHPQIAEEKRMETRMNEILRSPVSPLQEIDEDITIQTKTSHPYQGAVPKVQRKQIMKERNGRNSGKPYDQSKAAVHIRKEEAALDYKYPTSNLKENKPGNKKSDIMNILNSDSPECKQQ